MVVHAQTSYFYLILWVTTSAREHVAYQRKISTTAETPAYKTIREKNGEKGSKGNNGEKRIKKDKKRKKGQEREQRRKNKTHGTYSTGQRLSLVSHLKPLVAETLVGEEKGHFFLTQLQSHVRVVLVLLWLEPSCFIAIERGWY